MYGLSEAPLASMVRKLSLWRQLDAADHDAILALPHTLRSLDAGHRLIAEGERPTHACLLRQGYMYRQKTVSGGNRQILAIHVPGDLVDLQNVLLDVADHTVQALTQAHVALIPREAISKLATGQPRVGMAMWHDTLVDGAIVREWMASIGRRPALTRLAHLLCELLVRLRAIGLVQAGASYDIPMSQEQLADCTGMTPIHLNRMLMALERSGAIVRRGRAVTILDWAQLAATGDFDEAYLHLAGSR